MNWTVFEIYIEKELAPTLKHGDIVILDNLPAHKSRKAKAMLPKRDAWILFLPPYRRDLTPIEMASRNSKSSCERLKLERSNNSGETVTTFGTCAHQPNVGITSKPQGIEYNKKGSALVSGTRSNHLSFGARAQILIESNRLEATGSKSCVKVYPIPVFL